jgi:hypothetical protein
MFREVESVFRGTSTMFSGIVHHVPEGRAPCSRGLKPCYGVSSRMFRAAETMFSEGAHHVPGHRIPCSGGSNIMFR